MEAQTTCCLTRTLRRILLLSLCIWPLIVQSKTTKENLFHDDYLLILNTYTFKENISAYIEHMNILMIQQYQKLSTNGWHCFKRPYNLK